MQDESRTEESKGFIFNSSHYTTKLYNSTQWLIGAGESAKRKFLTGILKRCHSLDILGNVQDVLQVTMAKDFTYARCRSRVTPRDRASVSNSKQTPGDKLLEREILNTWEWFENSPDLTKENYLFGLLSFCDTDLLHMLGNVARVLIARETQNITSLQCDTASPNSEDYSSTVSESKLDLLVPDSSANKPVRCPDETQDNIESNIEDSPHPSKDSNWNQQKEVISRRQGWTSPQADWDDVEDPAHTVVLRSSRSKLGVNQYRDFIRALPVGLAKMILDFLDSATLQRCKHVSKHWKYLAMEIEAEQKVKKLVEKQAAILQGVSSAANPVYARIREVLVPIREDEVDIKPKRIPKYKEGTQGFESVFTKIKTKVVKMEERNVYCGLYNILMVLNREDPNRVIHYDGGRMVALSSKDRCVRLLDVIQLKEVPTVMRGHGGSVRAVLVCEKQELVVSAGYDLSIRCWNLKTGAFVMIFTGHLGTITSLDLHGSYLVSGAKDCNVKVWSLKTGQCCERMKFRHHNPVMCVKIDSSLVISGCQGGLIKMWHMDTANLLKVTHGHEGSVNCLFLDKFHILSGGSDGLVKAWSTDPNFNKTLMTFHHPREVLTLSCLFLRVITGSVDGKIRVFNLLTGNCLRVFKIGNSKTPVHSLHTHENSIVVNSSSHVLLLQFAEQQWNYTAPLEQDCIPAQTPPNPQDLPHPSPSQLKRRVGTPSLSQQMRSGNQYLTKKHVMTPGERAVQEHVRNRGTDQPTTSTQGLLKVHPHHQPEGKDLTTSSTPGAAPATRVPARPPALKVSKQPHTASTPSPCNGTLNICTPLKAQVPDLNIHRVLHPSVPYLALIQAIPKPRQLQITTTMTQEDIMRSASKPADHHVDFQIPAKSTQFPNPLDPFRESGEFQLRTCMQLKEYKQTQMQANTYTLSKDGKKRLRRTSLKRNFTRIKAPDLRKEM